MEREMRQRCVDFNDIRAPLCSLPGGGASKLRRVCVDFGNSSYYGYESLPEMR